MSVKKPPKEGGVDISGKIIKATIDSIVPCGPVISALLSGFIKSPYQKRIEEWQHEVTDALNTIQDGGIDLEQLKDNEKFIDTLLQTIPIWVKNHQTEKRQALKNAIIHSAQSDAPESSLQQTFLNCIDTFTVWHIKILALFSDPKNWLINNGEALPLLDIRTDSVRGVLERAFPELCRQDEFVDSVWSDLYNKKFISSDHLILQVTMTSQGTMDKRTTNFGDQFIDFISDS